MDREHFREYLRDIKTWPNAITLGRLAASPYITYKFNQNPSKWGPIAGLIGVTDNFDGGLARLGQKYPALQKHGFRPSELGRKADPITDKFYNGQLILGSFNNGVLDTPLLKTIGLASVAQKVAVGVQTYRHEKQGIELTVRPMGKIYEFMTNIGLGAVALAERVGDDQMRYRIKQAGAGLAVLGIAGATYETIQYARQAYELKHTPSDQTDSPTATELI